MIMSHIPYRGFIWEMIKKMRLQIFLKILINTKTYKKFRWTQVLRSAISRCQYRKTVETDFVIWLATTPKNVSSGFQNLICISCKTYSNVFRDLSGFTQMMRQEPVFQFCFQHIQNWLKWLYNFSLVPTVAS